MAFRTATLVLAIALLAVGLPPAATGGEQPDGDACERFAEYFLHTNGLIDQTSRRQCNTGPHAECDYIRHSLQKHVGDNDEGLNRYFFSLLPCGEAQHVDPRVP